MLPNPKHYLNDYSIPVGAGWTATSSREPGLAYISQIARAVWYLVTSDVTLELEAMTRDLSEMMEDRGLPHVVEAEYVVGAVADADGGDTDQPLLCGAVGYIKLELLQLKTKLNHFALKTKLYVQAAQVAFAALRELQPVRLAA